jgi:steroid delta-isomerase-like uncharacterized protein
MLISTREQAIDEMAHLEDDVRTLSDRWLPQAQGLRELIPRWLDAWNTHDLDTLQSLVTEDIAWEDPAMQGRTVHGRAEFRAFTQSLFRGIPDVRFEGLGATYLALDRDGLAVPWRMTGTFTGDLELWGTPSLAWAPTGRHVEIEGVDVYELRDGLISHWTIHYDLLGLSQQLGLFPPNDGPLLGPLVRLQRLAARVRRLAPAKRK